MFQAEVPSSRIEVNRKVAAIPIPPFPILLRGELRTHLRGRDIRPRLIEERLAQGVPVEGKLELWRFQRQGPEESGRPLLYPIAVAV